MNDEYMLDGGRLDYDHPAGDKEVGEGGLMMIALCVMFSRCKSIKHTARSSEDVQAVVAHREYSLSATLG